MSSRCGHFPLRGLRGGDCQEPSPTHARAWGLLPVPSSDSSPCHSSREGWGSGPWCRHPGWGHQGTPSLGLFLCDMVCDCRGWCWLQVSGVWTTPGPLSSWDPPPRDACLAQPRTSRDSLLPTMRASPCPSGLAPPVPWSGRLVSRPPRGLASLQTALCLTRTSSRGQLAPSCQAQPWACSRRRLGWPSASSFSQV